MLPPYLAANPAWQQLVESIDEVLENEIDVPTELLARIRDNWILGESALQRIDDEQMVSTTSDFFSFERETLIRQANMIGFLLKETSLLSDADYQRLVRNLAQYWFGKGTPRFIDFLGFCLNTTLAVVKLWSTQGPTYDSYGPFLEEGDPGIGVVNYLGGPWFETSHVRLNVDADKFIINGQSLAKLIALFNALANYHLVLDDVIFESKLTVHSPGDPIANINKAYPMIDIHATIETATFLVGNGQVFNILEGTAPGVVIGTVQAFAFIGAIDDFVFDLTGTNVSPDGFVQISPTGVMTLTIAGAASALNDFETLPNSFTYAVKVHNTLGTFSAPANILIKTLNIDDTAPVVAPGQSFSFAENPVPSQSIGIVSASDDAGVTAFRFTDSGTALSADGNFTISPAGLVSITNRGAGVATVGETTDFSTTVVPRMKPKYWLVNGPRTMSFALTTNGSDLRVDFTSRMHNDLCGLVWESEDRKDHRLLSYQTKKDYRNMTLDFDLAVSASQPVLNEPTQALSLTVEGRDALGNAKVYIIALFNYADTPSTRSAHVHIDFNTVAAGFFADQPTYMGDVDRMFVSCINSSFDTTDTPLAAPEPGWVEMNNVVVGGTNSLMNLGLGAVPAHNLGMATSYDDHYDQSPERIIDNTVALGYRGWINHYVGMSIYPEKTWNGTQFQVVELGNPFGLPLVCNPTKVWHDNFLALAHAASFDVIQAVSYEMFSLHANEAWIQRAFDDTPGTTGYIPPSYLLSPCNATGMGYLSQVFKEFALMANAVTGMSVYMQVGEPWWWVQPSTRKPCIYDFQTRLKFNTETGLFAEDIGTVDAPNTSATITAYRVFVKKELGLSVLAHATAVRSVVPTAKVSAMPFLPTILDNAVTADINLPNTQYHKGAGLDFFQTEEYDYLTGYVVGDPTVAMTYPLTTLGYLPGEVQYLGGFAPEYPTTASRHEIWRRIFRNLRDFEVFNVQKRHVWAYPLVMRDSVTYRESGTDRNFYDDGVYTQVEPIGAWDFEATPNSFILPVQARDAVGNWSASQNITVSLTNLEDIAPAVETLRTFTYVEGQIAGYVIGTLTAADDIGVTGFRFALSSTNVSPDGFFNISNSGVVTLTAAGAAGAANDFEVGQNEFRLLYQARDAAGNWSRAEIVTVVVSNIDDTVPFINVGQSFTYAENQTAGVTIGTVVAIDDFGVTNYRFTDSGTATSSDGFVQIDSAGHLSLTASGVTSALNDFETLPNSFTYPLQARDAAGNWSVSTDVTLDVTDVAELTGPTLTFWKENNTLKIVRGLSVEPSTGVSFLGIRSSTTAANGMTRFSETGAETWAKNYTDGVLVTRVFSVASLLGGDVVGQFDYDTSAKTALIRAVGASGLIDWQQTYDLPGEVQDSTEVLADDTHIWFTAATTQSGGTVPAALLAQVDYTGAVNWAKVITHANLISPTPGSIVDPVTGDIYVSMVMSGVGAGAAIAKYNSAGVLQWSNVYGPTGGNPYMKVRPSGLYMVTQDASTPSDPIVAKINKATGSVLWAQRLARTVPSHQTTFFQSMVMDTADNIYTSIADQSFIDEFLVKLTSSGALVFSRKFAWDTSVFDFPAYATVGNALRRTDAKSGGDLELMLPLDGTKTGTYGSGEGTMTYSVDNSFTLSVLSMTVTPVVLTESSPTLTVATPTFVAASSTDTFGLPTVI